MKFLEHFRSQILKYCDWNYSCIDYSPHNTSMSTLTLAYCISSTDHSCIWSSLFFLSLVVKDFSNSLF